MRCARQRAPLTAAAAVASLLVALAVAAPAAHADETADCIKQQTSGACQTQMVAMYNNMTALWSRMEKAYSNANADALSAYSTCINDVSSSSCDLTFTTGGTAYTTACVTNQGVACSATMIQTINFGPGNADSRHVSRDVCVPSSCDAGDAQSIVGSCSAAGSPGWPLGVPADTVEASMRAAGGDDVLDVAGRGVGEPAISASTSASVLCVAHLSPGVVAAVVIGSIVCCIACAFGCFKACNRSNDTQVYMTTGAGYAPLAPGAAPPGPAGAAPGLAPIYQGDARYQAAPAPATGAPTGYGGAAPGGGGYGTAAPATGAYGAPPAAGTYGAPPAPGAYAQPKGY